ncbi:hypothetical protein [Terrabacter terrigena]|uniref:Photosynthesis system II assembly factor Ycf48/Hcf136-like domain-containing protein n=1 Tax=Terrabacter terrigena TaxID=574718 RepID=A0ABW3MUZ7_9MICO
MIRWLSDNSAGRLALAGLLALLVVDAFLVAFAFRPDTAGAAPPTSAAATSIGTELPTAEPTRRSTAEPVSEVVVAASATRAWRATLGTCTDGGASIQMTTDGGKTWVSRKAPTGALGRVQPVGEEGRGFVVAARTGCAVGEYPTDDDGVTWRGPRAVDGGWSRAPAGASPQTVITPQQAASRPCGNATVVDLARASASSAFALCAGGQVMRSTDGGARWSQAAAVDGALALSVRSEKGGATAYVARLTAQCSGVELARLAGRTASKVACVETDADVTGGRVSVSVVESAGWLTVAGSTWRADAGLSTWRATA